MSDERISCRPFEVLRDPQDRMGGRQAKLDSLVDFLLKIVSVLSVTPALRRCSGSE